MSPKQKNSGRKKPVECQKVEHHHQIESAHVVILKNPPVTQFHFSSVQAPLGIFLFFFIKG